LGNDSPAASLPGEVIPGDDFYTYNAKYLADTSKLIIPAALPVEVTEQIRTYAVQVYKAMDCAGMARVDFLIDRLSQQVFISEVNTIPGFTRISMYPKLWEATGLSYPALIEKLIDLALERQTDREHTVYEYRRIG
jgi:D-alanine-D-alanine ligase